MWTTSARDRQPVLLTAVSARRIAVEAGQRWPRFWRRWLQIAGCAVLVSIALGADVPRSWIVSACFHGIAVMLIVARLAAPLRGWLLPLGALSWCCRNGSVTRSSDTRWTHWVGLVTRKPVTEDWVPVLPWLGVVLWGVALGQWLLRRAPMLLAGPLARPLLPLALLGRWSLSVYMVHQPLLIGAILAAGALGRG